MKKILLLLALSFSTTLHSQDSISVLFIGNSYTYVNDLPIMTSNLATSLGKTITVDSKTNGGYTFQNHTTDALTFSKIHAKPWDVVIIQGQSQEPSFPDSQVNSSTLPYAVKLADSVYASNFCSNVMYFMTWGRKDGDPQWSEINTFEKMNTRLYNAYMRIADSSEKAMVSPVGSVWAYVRQNHPTIDLYSGDGSHPSLAGTYLSACVFYTALFRGATTGAPYLGGLDATTAGILQTAADHVLDSLQKFKLHPVSEPTQADFEFSQSGATIQFTNESSRATSYSWDFGDLNSSTAENPSHTYTNNGTYTVELTATSSCNSSTISKQLLVTTAGLKEEDVSLIEIKKHNEGIHILPIQKELELMVVTVDGKTLIHSLNIKDEGVWIQKSNQLIFIQAIDNSGRNKVVRIMN